MYVPMRNFILNAHSKTVATGRKVKKTKSEKPTAMQLHRSMKLS